MEKIYTATVMFYIMQNNRVARKIFFKYKFKTNFVFSQVKEDRSDNLQNQMSDLMPPSIFSISLEKVCC